MTESSPPRVTIGLPVFNGENFLTSALRSLAGQDYPNLHIVIGDNGSTDATPQICKEFAASNANVTYLRSPENRGAAWNYNRLLDHAEGDYFKWQAHDDMCAPTLVSQCVDALERDPAVVVAYPQTALIDTEDAVVGEMDDDMDLADATAHARLRRFLSIQTEYHPVFGVIRLDALRQTGLIGPYIGSDVVLLAELAMRGEFREVAGRLFLRRFHDQTSWHANTGEDSLATWFDPANAGRVAMPVSRMSTELVKSVWAADLPTTERVRCLRAVAGTWMLPRWRYIGGECKRAVRLTARRRLRPSDRPRTGSGED